MKASFLLCNAVIGAAICGCSSHSDSTVIKWNFSSGMGGWQTLYPESAEIVRGDGVSYLRIHNPKLPAQARLGGMWTHVALNQSQAKTVSLLVAAKTDIPRLSVNIHITCQTGKQDGPTYGVLLSNSVDKPLTADWATYRMAIDIPDGTQELEFVIKVEPSMDASIDIRSIECSIE